MRNTKAFTIFSNVFKQTAAKNILLVVAVVCLATVSFSCKKTVEQQQENIILDAMVNGRWYVEEYLENTSDVSSAFSGYEFQFYKNGTVDGIKSSVTKTGNWNTDITNYTITAAFSASANDTLRRLNYTWKITDSYLDYVQAKTTTASGDNILHLRKK